MISIDISIIGITILLLLIISVVVAATIITIIRSSMSPKRGSEEGDPTKTTNVSVYGLIA